MTLLLLPIALVAIAIVLIYIPAVQQWAVNRVTRTLHERTGISVSVGRVHLGFPLRLTLQEVKAFSPQGDTIALLGELTTQIPISPLFDSRIETSELSVKNVYFDSFVDSLKQSRITTRAERILGGNVHVDIGKKEVGVTSLSLSRGFFTFLTTDTIPNPNPKPVLWKIGIDEADIVDFDARVVMPFHRVHTGAHIKKGRAHGIGIELEDFFLKIDNADMHIYDGGFALSADSVSFPYVDYTHMTFYDVYANLDNFLLKKRFLSLFVNEAQLRERSGAKVNDFNGGFKLDNGVVSVSDFSVQTPQSNVAGNVVLPLSIFKKDSLAVLQAEVKGNLHPDDIAFFTSFDLNNLSRIPNTPLFSQAIDADIDLQGTLQDLTVKKISLSAPNVFDLSVAGRAQDILSSTRRKGSMELKLRTGSGGDFVFSKLLPQVAGRVRIPNAILLDLEAKVRGPQLMASSTLKHFKEGVHINGSYNLNSTEYAADLAIQNLNLKNFLPLDPIGMVSATFSAQGRGSDIFDPRTKARFFFDLGCIEYKGAEISDVILSGLLSDASLSAYLNSRTPGAQADVQIEARAEEKKLLGTIGVDIIDLNLQQLGLRHTPLGGRLSLEGNLSTDFDQTHRLYGHVKDIHMLSGNDSLFFESFIFDGSTSNQVVNAFAESGDLRLSLKVSNGLHDLTERLTRLSSFANKFTTDSIGEISLGVPLRLLPSLSMDVAMGQNNPLQYLLRDRKLSIGSLSAYVETDSVNGITGDFSVRDFRSDTLRIDHAYLNLATDISGSERQLDKLYQLSDRLTDNDMKPIMFRSMENALYDTTKNASEQDALLILDLKVTKERYRNQKAFNLSVSAKTDLRSADLYASYATPQGIQYAAGLLGYYNSKGFGVAIRDDQPIILAGENLTVNPDNSVFYFREGKNVFANLQLKGFENAEIKLVSNNDSALGIDRVNLIISRLQLSRIASLTGLNVPLSGIAFGDILLERTDGRIRASGDLSVNNFLYNKSNIGNIGLAMFYEPKDKTSHYLTAQLNHNGHLSLSAEGLYNSAEERSPIKVDASFSQFPLDLINPILGADLATISGTLQGDINVSGTVQNLLLNGEALFNETKVLLPQLGNTFVLDSRPLKIQQSRLHFDHYTLRVEGKKEPLYLDGDIVLAGNQALATNLQIKANEVQLVDSSYKPGQMFYGKLFASADISVRGRLSAPIVRGKIGILGGTNLTYVYSKSAVKSADRMSGVVEFTDFTDTLFIDRKSLRLGESQSNMDIALTAQIDPAVIAGVDLSAGHQDYAQVVGGGSIRFMLPPYGEMSLIGVYEAQGGEIRYNFPVVGRKTFNIQPNSTVSFSGRADNPYINFKATQRVRASVLEGEESRKVNFDVSIQAQETLENLDLRFDLEAPEDMSVQNKIASMSQEERAKQAVGLVVSGTFLASDPSQMNMEKILSDLAVNELNNLVGKTLEGTDFNVGMELNDNSAKGNTYTNYTYSFARRFYNDRIRFVIGGKVAAGNLPTGYQQTFIDNVTVEYRLDKAGRQYVSLFHKRNSDNILEGLINETGVGYTIKNKLDRLVNLFDFLRPRRKPEEEADTRQEKTFADSDQERQPNVTTDSTVLNSAQ